MSQQNSAMSVLNQNEVIFFRFSEFEYGLFNVDYNVEGEPNGIKPITGIERNIKELELVISSKGCVLLYKGENDFYPMMTAKMNNATVDQLGNLQKLEGISQDVSSTINTPITVEFDRNPLSFFSNSEKNIVITVHGVGSFSPEISQQWVFLNRKNFHLKSF